MKTSLVGVLFFAGLLGSAFAQSPYVDFTTPASVQFVANYSSGTNFSNQSLLLPNNGELDIAFPTNDGSLFFDLADATTLTSASGQWKFAVENPQGAPLTVNGFSASLSGLFAGDGKVITGVDLITGASSSQLLTGTVGSFNIATGTFTLTHAASFVIPAQTTVTLVGNFSTAVPEPATGSLLAALAVLGVSSFSLRRRRSHGSQI